MSHVYKEIDANNQQVFSEPYITVPVDEMTTSEDGQVLFERREGDLSMLQRSLCDSLNLHIYFICNFCMEYAITVSILSNNNARKELQNDMHHAPADGSNHLENIY